MGEVSTAMDGVAPARLAAVEQFTRRIGLHMAHSRWPLAAQVLAEARDTLDGLGARRALGGETPLAAVLDGIRGRDPDRDELLLRAVNALEAHLDVITVGDLHQAGWGRAAAVPNIGPQSLLVLADALIEFAFFAGTAGDDDEPRTGRRAAS